VVEQGTHKSLNVSAVLRAWEPELNAKVIGCNFGPSERCANQPLTLAARALSVQLSTEPATDEAPR
jgi:hypothetical protein